MAITMSRPLALAVLLLAAAGLVPPAVAQGTRTPAGELDRTVLPIPEPSYPPITELDARKAKAPPRFEVKAPNGVPEEFADVLRYIDSWGDPTTYPHYSAGWAVAGTRRFHGPSKSRRATAARATAW